MTAASELPAGGDVVVFDTPRARRVLSPGDMLRLALGVVLVLFGSLIASAGEATISGVEEDLIRAFERLPEGIAGAVLGVTQIVVSVLPLVVLVALLVKRRWRVAILLIAASAGASLALAIADSVVLDRALSEVLQSFEAQNDAFVDASFPGANVIASTTAVVTVAAPWLSVRWKRALWSAVGLLVLLRLVAVVQPALDLVIALGIGTVVGSTILLIFGSPNTEPQPSELISALRSLDIDPAEIDRSRTLDGALRYDVVERDGSRVVAKLRTPDDRDAELLNRWIRGWRYRASEVRLPYRTVKRRIEHEALVLSLADRAGVRALQVLRIGQTERGAAFYVASSPESRPATVEDLSSRAVLEDLWLQVARLHDAGIAHRHLALEAFHIDDAGRAWLLAFDDAEIAPAPRERARDVAQLLTETALVLGVGDAVAAAVDAMGTARVASALRMLQPLALSPATRARVKAVPDLLDELRSAVSSATGEPDLELDELERIKPRTLLIIGASSLAFYALLPQLANLDETADAFRQAEPFWLVAALVASALTYFFAAISFQGAVAEPMPFLPTLRAQVASSFAGLVGPAGAGGLALTVRFLERFGTPRSEATASVAVDAIAGFAVHLALMFGFFVWAGNTDLGGFSLPDSHTVLLVLTIGLALTGILLAIGPVRRKVFAPLWAAIRSGSAAIARVFANPVRVSQLFGGSVGISLTYLATLACTIAAFGGDIGLPQIGAAYLGAVAISTLAPTPGGLGAFESALIAALTGFGLNAGIAVSATLTFRLATFWLPILPGWLAVNTMQRNEEV